MPILPLCLSDRERWTGTIAHPITMSVCPGGEVIRRHASVCLSMPHTAMPIPERSPVCLPVCTIHCHAYQLEDAGHSPVRLSVHKGNYPLPCLPVRAAGHSPVRSLALRPGVGSLGQHNPLPPFPPPSPEPQAQIKSGIRAGGRLDTANSTELTLNTRCHSGQGHKYQ